MSSTWPRLPGERQWSWCALEILSSLQDHVGLFVRHSRGGVGVGLPMVLTGGGGDREEVELLRPEIARLFTQLESVFFWGFDGTIDIIMSTV